MNKYRLFVEKKLPYRVEAESLRKELNANLQLDIKELRLVVVYDVFGADDEIREESRFRVFGEKVTDDVSENWCRIGSSDPRRLDWISCAVFCL